MNWTVLKTDRRALSWVQIWPIFTDMQHTCRGASGTWRIRLGPTAQGGAGRGGEPNMLSER